MSGPRIDAEVAFSEWRKDPTYVEAYDELANEFAEAGALIHACADVEPTWKADEPGKASSALPRRP